MVKILIVDDEPNIVMALEHALKKKGFDVYIALNGKEALEICQVEKPCLMVLDIMMPDMDGFEVLEKVKKNKYLHKIKTLFLSAKNKPEDMERGMQAGAEDYITKPFSTKKLIEKITYHCQN